MPKPSARSEAKSKPNRESATANEAEIGESKKPTGPPPPWVPIVGVTFLGLAVVFFMGLVVSGLQVQDRGLVCIVLALATSIGSGFLGGSASASGQISVPILSPVTFGVTGGVAVFVIILLLCHFLYTPPPTPPCPRAPEITNVVPGTNGNSLLVDVEFSPVNLSSQCNLYAEIATDKEFKQPDEKEVNSCRSPCLISFPKPQQLELWFRFVVKTTDDKVATVSNPRKFKIPK